ncbi:MAG: 1-acyl-sn-glycerol-3-phosphate acyltransferase [Micrococcales bacterium 73-13]|nr:MAG: 1-acyl-sn-glycerol-3-phosphate acyltransferase [Micrococcales bacterium 73-13]
MFYWFLKHVLVGPFLWTVFRPWVRGVEHVPRQGPVILAGNHVSFLDSIFMPLVLDRKVTFLAKSEYFTGKGLKGWLTRLFFTGAGQLPIDRAGGKASEASLNTGLQVLAAGDQLGIYPEGTRSPDGRLYRGRTGIARMVLESGAVVVPAVVFDTDKVMPLGSRWPRIHRVGVVFGEPMDFSRYAGLESDRFVLRAVTDEIVYEIARLSGQEYVDVYASSVRGRAAEAAAPSR